MGSARCWRGCAAGSHRIRLPLGARYVDAGRLAETWVTYFGCRLARLRRQGDEGPLQRAARDEGRVRGSQLYMWVGCV